MSIHDFDKAVVIFSIGLSQYLMVDRLIGNTRVSMNKKGHETITNKRRHSITLDLLYRKSGIVLEKEKWTLK